MPPASPPSPHRTARQAQFAFACLGACLLVLNVAGVLLVRSYIVQQERNLTDYLALVGSAVTEYRDSYQILDFVYDPSSGRIDEEALAFYSTTVDWETLRAGLAAAMKQKHVERADLLTPSGEIILRGDGTSPPPGERTPYLLDQSALASATAGSMASPALTPGDPTKRLYMPLVHPKGRTLAVLRLEHNPLDFSALRTSRNRFFLGFFGATALLVFLYFQTMRLVRRTIEAERGASQADRLRALGTMTAGIAHEIRNPLNIISLQVEELRASVPAVQEESTRKALTQIAEDLQSETRRLKELTQTFLNFSRTTSAPTTKAVAVDAHRAVEKLFRLWEKGLDPRMRRVAFVNDAPAGTRVLFTEDRLRQVLLNLLRNADEALGTQAGEITLTMALKASSLHISVRDTGPGIDPANLNQIFDPFFTTRAEGTGLGLSLTKALVEGAGGKLEVESKPGKGACFTAILPVPGM